ncbi:hypothetical protein CLMAG_27840 [Clostridium magnum DSM 2767]|uniref:Uncharacterized protein n=1 Tax=Clostridium magnum DSM 2767 TaxID=1121326 RepID=A0A162TRR3_9CLOT|nr:hypothetical protein CLMAG_27840 [Clostridium magnum DSM 2767]
METSLPIILGILLVIMISTVLYLNADELMDLEDNSER